MTLEEGRALVEACEAAGVRLAGQPEHAVRPLGPGAQRAARPRRPRRAGAGDDRDAGHPPLDALGRGRAVALDLHHEHPPPRHLPLLARRPRPGPRQHPARPADEVRPRGRDQPVHPRIRQVEPRPRPGTTSGPAPPAKEPAPSRSSAGESRGPKAWPSARSAGPAGPSESPARSTTRRPSTKANGTAPAGPNPGSPTPSPGPWPASSDRDRNRCRARHLRPGPPRYPGPLRSSATSRKGAPGRHDGDGTMRPARR